MNCSNFMARFSDFHDREADFDQVEDFEEHLRLCASCRQYEEVVRNGVELLRSMPAAEISEDFHLRLQHRIFHVDDEQAFLKGQSSAGSGTTAATALAMAVLLVVVAWSPAILSGDPDIHLPAIVINDPPPRPAPATTVNALLLPNSRLQDRPLWNHTHSLLYEYSLIAERNRAPVHRAGFD